MAEISLSMTPRSKRSQPGKSETDDLSSRRELVIEQAFQQYWELICSVVDRLVGSREEAEDIALEAFLRLHLNPPDRNENIAGWLYRVATRLGLNALRSRHRRRWYETQVTNLVIQEAQIDTPEALLEARQEGERVRAALARLNTRQAQLLVLRTNGLSYAEIAIALEIPPASVGTYLARAEKEFEKQYKKKSK